MTNQYDTIIIGAGQNNLTLAPLLRERGMQPPRFSQVLEVIDL